MVKRRTRFPSDMLVLDRDADVPMHRQLYEKLRAEILAGHLKADTRLPPTRMMAEDLGVSRNTVITTYDALLAEGYLESRSGSGTWVATLPADAVTARNSVGRAGAPSLSSRGMRMAAQPRDRTIPDRIAFHPGYPEIKAFPFSTWARLLKRHARYSHEDLYGYHWVTGHPRLKAAIAEYLRASRGVECAPEQVIVVNGTQAALDILARMLVDEGDICWMEEPGYIGAQNSLLSAGAKLVPLPVERDGWSLEDETRPSPRLIFVTPSCQWPLGCLMRMEDRLRLLQIGERHDAWIVEDDYDSEYRFRGRPVPAMQGLDKSGRVIYMGTFAKTLFPSLRIGFIVVPPQLADGFKRVVSNTGHYPSLLLQAALADFISEGYFATHLRRMRRLYAERQKVFVALCRRHLADWLTIDENDAGMQLVARFTRALEDEVLWRAAQGQGVNFSPLSRQFFHSPPQQGAILGYAGIDPKTMREGINSLRSAFLALESSGALPLDRATAAPRGC
ncbi:GntR family transcriptional regulator/MocR family aminotransferase [Sinorhizobium meliloti]|nr:PLP-dependent aminotransferase family protein [Sinorhizobium meliloti]AEG07066.1 transcriptional regulator, GntR family with aminotransferase domain [Sinorhizobium meliloti BL225C]MDE4547940.1 PLP-dependent aminotransferase family protein [Sinorhizobium meliloti]MDE4571559.1 PLP-dependent aminotransferase family protein [Sinorhizobium meliloti]SDZ48139.1 GntR family transcriptional regulator / MocR family aminotransferase [Sinorhizobium meliloti]